MKIDTIAAKIAYYVVDNFDTEHMKIRTRKGLINVTAESVNHILGLKNQGVDLLTLERDEE